MYPPQKEQGYFGMDSVIACLLLKAGMYTNLIIKCSQALQVMYGRHTAVGSTCQWEQTINPHDLLYTFQYTIFAPVKL